MGEFIVSTNKIKAGSTILMSDKVKYKTKNIKWQKKKAIFIDKVNNSL